MRSFSRPVVHALLALLLLFTQYGVVLHALDHAMDNAAQRDVKELPRNVACERCLAHAGLDAASPPGLPAFDAPRMVQQAAAAPVASLYCAAAPSAYRARAPPVHA